MINALARLQNVSQRFLSRVDVPLLLALLFIMLVSLIVQFSAGGSTLQPVLAQGARFVLGIVVLLLLANTSPANLRAWTPWVYGFTLALMPLVFVFG